MRANNEDPTVGPVPAAMFALKANEDVLRMGLAISAKWGMSDRRRRLGAQVRDGSARRDRSGSAVRRARSVR